ncbi:MAG TPA: hypothetical protein VNG12_08885 [Acidimicrobiales bacterium]|nr:hypothetical protein [Acidimicrobiales bacterium]
MDEPGSSLEVPSNALAAVAGSFLPQVPALHFAVDGFDMVGVSPTG